MDLVDKVQEILNKNHTHDSDGYGLYFSILGVDEIEDSLKIVYSIRKISPYDETVHYKYFLLKQEYVRISKINKVMGEDIDIEPFVLDALPQSKFMNNSELVDYLQSNFKKDKKVFNKFIKK